MPLNPDIIIAKQEDIADELSEKLESILGAVKSLSNQDLIMRLEPLLSDISNSFKSVNTEAKEIDVSGIESAIKSMDLSVDLSPVSKNVSSFDKNLLSLNKKVHRLSQLIADLNSVLSKDTKISVERSNGVITNLYLIRK